LKEPSPIATYNLDPGNKRNGKLFQEVAHSYATGTSIFALPRLYRLFDQHHQHIHNGPGFALRQLCNFLMLIQGKSDECHFGFVRHLDLQ
jgi:hypothetical protein